MSVIILIVVILLIGTSIYTYRVLGGKSLKPYDQNLPLTFDVPKHPDGIGRLNAYLDENFGRPAQSASANTGWKDKRQRFDDAGLARDFDCEFRTDKFKYDGITIDGDWTLVKGLNPNKRILYLHGGAFTVGSAISHRPLTYNIAKRTGCVVFAPNYRLMPEHSRKAGIEDCRAAYSWILDNGPNGPSACQAIGVAGDSAGGNLTLMINHWTRNNSQRQPNAVVAISPITDATLSSPSLKKNLDTDLILAPLLKPVLRVPRALLLWGLKKAYGFRPSDPSISPIHDDLAGLSPTLIHASQTEMLYDDGARYASKAKAHGSPIVFQSWTNLPHVWHIFDDYVDEAHAALDEISAFFKRNGVSK